MLRLTLSDAGLLTRVGGVMTTLWTHVPEPARAELARGMDVNDLLWIGDTIQTQTVGGSFVSDDTVSRSPTRDWSFGNEDLRLVRLMGDWTRISGPGRIATGTLDEMEALIALLRLTSADLWHRGFESVFTRAADLIDHASLQTARVRIIWQLDAHRDLIRAFHRSLSIDELPDPDDLLVELVGDDEGSNLIDEMQSAKDHYPTLIGYATHIELDGDIEPIIALASSNPMRTKLDHAIAMLRLRPMAGYYARRAHRHAHAS